MKIRQARPPIDVTNADINDQLRDVFDGLRTVNKEPTLFSQNGRLVVCEIVESDDGEKTRLVAQVDHAMLRTWLVTHFAFEKTPPPTRNNPNPLPVPTNPSPQLLDALLSIGEWIAVPELRDVSEMPIVTKTGEVVEERGYHPSTRIFLGPIVPLQPDKLVSDPHPTHVQRAIELLMTDVLGDFQFKEEEDKANALAAIITAPTRFMYDCPLPLYLFDSTNPGSGKGTLAGVVGEMWGGSLLMPATDDEEEFRKRILPALGATERVIIFDNVETELGNATWNALLTSTQWTDRILGSSKTATLPNNKLWCATGNNIDLGRDMPRRCAWVFQDPQSDPSKRTESDFRHPNIIQWVRDEQHMLRWAVLTLVMRWISDGMPLSTVSCDNMTPWAQTVGGILENVGINGFLRDRLKGGVMDSESVELMNFIDAVGTVFGNSVPFTAKEVADRLPLGGGLVAFDATQQLLLDSLPSPVRSTQARGGAVAMSLGRYLKHNTGRFVGPSEARVVVAPTSSPRAPVYMVEGALGVVAPSFTGF